MEVITTKANLERFTKLAKRSKTIKVLSVFATDEFVLQALYYGAVMTIDTCIQTRPQATIIKQGHAVVDAVAFYEAVAGLKAQPEVRLTLEVGDDTSYLVFQQGGLTLRAWVNLAEARDENFTLYSLTTTHTATLPFAEFRDSVLEAKKFVGRNYRTSEVWLVPEGETLSVVGTDARVAYKSDFQVSETLTLPEKLNGLALTTFTTSLLKWIKEAEQVAISYDVGSAYDNVRLHFGEVTLYSGCYSSVPQIKPIYASAEEHHHTFTCLGSDLIPPNLPEGEEEVLLYSEKEEMRLGDKALEFLSRSGEFKPMGFDAKILGKIAESISTQKVLVCLQRGRIEQDMERFGMATFYSGNACYVCFSRDVSLSSEGGEK